MPKKKFKLPTEWFNTMEKMDKTYMFCNRLNILLHSHKIEVWSSKIILIKKILMTWKNTTPKEQNISSRLSTMLKLYMKKKTTHDRRIWTWQQQSTYGCEIWLILDNLYFFVFSKKAYMHLVIIKNKTAWKFLCLNVISGI